MLRKLARGALVLLALGLSVAFVMLHTSAGRELLREQVEARLGRMFTGRVSVGKIEGDPFGELVLRDLAVDAIDGRPAIRIRAITVQLAFLPLAQRRLHLDKLVIEGADLHIAKDESGRTEFTSLMQKKKRSGWALELPDVRVIDSRVDGVTAIELRGSIFEPSGGDVRIAAIGTARFRDVPVFATAVVSADREHHVAIPSALVTANGVLAIVAGGRVHDKELTGVAIVDAPREAAARFGVKLPDDIRALATIYPENFINVIGTLGESHVQAIARVDVPAKRARGLVMAAPYATPEGVIGGVAAFDLQPGSGLPIGTGIAMLTVDGRGAAGGRRGSIDALRVGHARVGLAFTSDGTRASFAVDGNAPGTHLLAGGALTRVEKRIELFGAKLVASTTAVPGVRGALSARLAVSGEVTPSPDLAVAGTLDSGPIETHGASATAAHLVIDARHLPSRPIGKADVKIAGLAKGKLQLGLLSATASSRADGTIAVSIDSHPPDAASRIQADAVVTPGHTVDIALGKHTLRIAGSSTWTGEGGRITIAPEKVAVIGVRSNSPFGTFALDGALDRRTRRVTGALAAKSPMVDALDANVALVLPEAGHSWRDAIELASVRAVGIHAEPALLASFGIGTELGATIDVSAELSKGAHAGHVAAYVHQVHGRPIAKPVDVRLEATTDEHSTHGTVAIRGPGGVNLGDLELSLPRAAEDIDRATPIAGHLVLTTAPAPMFFWVLGRDALTGGNLDGAIAIAGTLGDPSLDGRLIATNLTVPPQHGKPLQILDRLSLAGSWHRGDFALSVDGKERAGGSLRATATGRLDHREAITFTLAAKHFDLAPVLVLAPGPVGGASGRLDADLTMTGVDLRTARLGGKLHVSDARIPLAANVGTLREATVDVALADDQLTLAIDGKLGKGTVKGSGTINLADNDPDHGQLVVAVRKVAPIGAVAPVMSADITATLHRDAKKWVADVVIDHGDVVVPRRKGDPLHPIGAPAEMVFVDGSTPKPQKKKHVIPTNPAFVANIELRPTHVVDADIRGVIAGKITVSETGRELGIVGEVHAQHGNLDLFGRRYDVERAAIHFDGSTDPLLDVRVSHDYSDVTATTTMRGRWSKPELVMTANPGIYSQGQLLGFLLGGQPSGDPRDVTARDRTSGAGSSVLGNELGAYIRGVLPINIDVLRYESATTENSSALTAGTWLTHALFVGYRYHMQARPDENNGEGELELWLGHKISIEGAVGDRGYDGIDLLWRKRY